MTDRPKTGRRKPNIVFHHDREVVSTDALGRPLFCHTVITIPFSMRKRGGRARIVPPEHPVDPGLAEGQAHVLRAVGRAWRWRRMLETGEVSTLTEIADREDVSLQYVSRLWSLAYLSPEVLEALVVQRRATRLTLTALAALADRPWAEQMGVVFLVSATEAGAPKHTSA